MREVHNVTPTMHILAKPDPYKDRSVSKKKLKKVYRSYGFKDVKGIPGYMSSSNIDHIVGKK